MIATGLTSNSPGEWIRIVACQLARRSPTLSADDAIDLAIAHYSALADIPPEQAAVELCTLDASQRSLAQG